MITRCEARITAQLELLASLSPWEPKSLTLRQEVDVHEGMLQSLHTQRVRLLFAAKEPLTPCSAPSGVLLPGRSAQSIALAPAQQIWSMPLPDASADHAGAQSPCTFR